MQLLGLDPGDAGMRRTPFNPALQVIDHLRRRALDLRPDFDCNEQPHT
jgi:hypothetical protein